MSDREFLDTKPHLSAFATPLLTIDASATAHNVALMMEWLGERGLEIAPHGKTTMAPRMWQQLLDAGAWGITLATGWQLQVARSHGISRVLVANELIDPVVLAWLGAELVDPSFEVACWVDSVETVELMRPLLARAARPLDVVVELGGARTGARTTAAALEIAAAAEAAPELQLAGVGGYEGSLAHDRSPASVDAVRRYVEDVVAVHDAIAWDRKPIVTAGGSAYFDLVAEGLAPLRGRATVILRSGAFQVHDEGFYRGITPMAGFRSAMHGWARVISRPEPGLAILDGGKRDFPYDEGMPVTEFGPVEKLNDQHAYLRAGGRSAGDVPRVGEIPQLGQVLRLGLSHPCTAFDKWRIIPVIASADEIDPAVVDLVRTWF